MSQNKAKQLYLSPDLIELIENYQEKNFLSSFNGAATQLILKGLQKENLK